MHTAIRFSVISLLLVVFTAMSGCASTGDSMKHSPSLTNMLGIATLPIKDLRKDYLTPESEWVDINGLNIHYRDVGEGDVIVLVHGVMSSLHTWNDWTEELSKEYRVISLDVPGFGLTGPPENLQDLNEEWVVNTFAKFIDDLELEHFSLVGNSFGGYIAAQYAAQYPEQIDRLILIDPAGYPQEVPWIMDFATQPGVSHVGAYIQPTWIIAQNVHEVYGDPSRISDYHMKRYIDMAQRPGNKASYIHVMKLLKERSTVERPMPFFKIKAPTLIMWGEQDKWVPLYLSDRWKDDIHHAEILIYPGAGHVPMEEIPRETVKDAMAFFNGTLDVAARSRALRPPAPQPAVTAPGGAAETVTLSESGNGQALEPVSTN